jgi:phosphoribosylformylglycinamidine synthase
VHGISEACRALDFPVVSGNVSLYNDVDGASIPPTPVVGCVGLVPDVRRAPNRWQRGDAVLLASSPDGSLAAEAALIRFLWKAAPHLTLAHDVGSAGIAAALAEAAAWSDGLEAEVEIPADYDSRRGAAILACRPGRAQRLGARGFVQIGQVQ